MKCAECRYYEDDHHDQGHCHRYPPKFDYIKWKKHGESIPEWFCKYYPVVNIHDFCGEFESKKSEGPRTL